MTAFLAECMPRAFAGLLAAAIAVGAAAQPVELRRPVPGESRPAPLPAPPAESVSSGEEVDASRPAGEIVFDTLDPIDPDTFGLIGADQGGFGVDVWRGVGWETVSRLMPHMPGLTTSATMRALASRLLLSRALVPAGKPANVSFVGLRIDRLLAMAKIEEAFALLKAVPVDRRDSAFSKIEVETLFFDNRNAEACARVEEIAGKYPEVYWNQAQAFCVALGGDQARTALIADLLRERQEEIDPAFFTALESLAGLEVAEVESLDAPGGLLLSMMRVAGLKLPESLTKSADPAILRWVARAPNADLEIRLAAAEKALGAHVLAPADVMRAYQGIRFTDEELANPVSRAEADWGPRGRALLMRAVSAQSSPVAKAELLRRAWKIGRERGGYGVMVRMGASEVSGITPSSELTWFAEDAARALFGAGRIAEAMAWYGALAGASAAVDEARNAEAGLWPLALLADGQMPLDSDRLARWYVDLRQSAPGEARGKALILFGLLDAAGRDLPWRILLDMPPAGSGTDPAWTRSLAAAAAADRVGETVLLAAVLVGSGAAPPELAAALRSVGLEEEGRRLALEIAVAAGL